MSKTFQNIRGFRDLSDFEAKKMQYVVNILYKLAETFSFTPIFTPIIEDINLFIRSVGDATDIVNKEIFSFEYSQQVLCLRPETTASVVKYMINKGLSKARLCYFGPNFRKERPQAGRYRQFYQFGFEILGEKDMMAEIDSLEIVHDLMFALKIPYKIKINSIGDLESRQKYVAVLKKYFEDNYENLSELSKNRYTENRILRILDSKEEEDVDIIKKAPIIEGFLSLDSQLSFETILQYLESKNIPYEIDYKLVRGLDYYNDFVFELYTENNNQAIAGGGRYDGLFHTLASQHNSAMGFAIGLDRLIDFTENSLLKKKEEILMGFLYKNFEIYNHLDEIKKEYCLISKADNLSNLLRYADKNSIKYVLLIGEEFIQKKQVIIRNMSTSEQIQISANEINSYFF